MGRGATHIDLPDTPCEISSSTSASPISVNNSSPLSLNQYSSTTASCASQTANQDKTLCPSLYDSVFGTAPSRFEIETAISALYILMQRISSSGLLEWMGRYGRVEHAINLLQKDPIIQRMVVSLSSDKALWNALMNNEMMQKLRGSYVGPAKTCMIQSCNQETDPFGCMVDFIISIIKAKITELIQNFQSLVNEIFKSSERQKSAEGSREVDDKIISSLLLSALILLTVVVARLQGA